MSKFSNVMASLKSIEKKFDSSTEIVTYLPFFFYKISVKWNIEIFCYRNVYFYSEDDASPASQWE